MWTRSSARISRRWRPVAALLLLLPLAAFAYDRKEDLYKQAAAAAIQGKAEEAARLYCEVSKIDPGFKDSKMMCSIMTLEVQKEQKKNEERSCEALSSGMESQVLHPVRYSQTQQPRSPRRYTEGCSRLW